jgi:transposase
MRDTVGDNYSYPSAVNTANNSISYSFDSRMGDTSLRRHGRLWTLPTKEIFLEEIIRKAAIRRYILQGESPKIIYLSLKRSKQWFYKWLKRYHTQGKEWHKNRDCLRTAANNQAKMSGANRSFRDKAPSRKNWTN